MRNIQPILVKAYELQRFKLNSKQYLVEHSSFFWEGLQIFLVAIDNLDLLCWEVLAFESISDCFFYHFFC